MWRGSGEESKEGVDIGVARGWKCISGVERDANVCLNGVAKRDVKRVWKWM